MENQKKHAPLKYFGKRIKTAPVLFAAMVIFALFFFGSGIYFAIIGQSRNSIMSFAFTLIIPAFYVIEGLLRVKVSTVFAIFLMLFSAGTIIGACYDVYTYVPFFDTILHGMWGVVFVVMGFVIAKKFFGETDTNKSFFGCLMLGFFFCLAMALVWELFEYLSYVVGGYDMQEDEIMTEFYSYYLSEGHLHIEPIHIDNITHTIIFYGDGQQYTIPGGYLDIGLIDTEVDMAICFICSVIFFGIMTADWFLGKRLYKWLIPSLLEDKPSDGKTEEVDMAQSEQVAEADVQPDQSDEISDKTEKTENPEQIQ